MNDLTERHLQKRWPLSSKLGRYWEMTASSFDPNPGGCWSTLTPCRRPTQSAPSTAPEDVFPRLDRLLRSHFFPWKRQMVKVKKCGCPIAVAVSVCFIEMGEQRDT